MKLIVGITLVLCLVFLVDRAEANTSMMDVLNQFGALDVIFKVLGPMIMKMVQAVEALIRNGKSMMQAISEVMGQLPQMLS